jgi:hypothetical protein
MSTGAHVRPDPQEAIPQDRRRSSLPVPKRRATDREYELEAIREAFDRELDQGHAVAFERVVRICRTFARHLAARGGRL